MDYHEDIESSGHNLQSGAVFICQLARAGRKNVAKTHRLLKVGIAMLIVALVLYMVGFLSPYWVVGDTHGHGAPVGNATKGFRWSNFSHNDSHFGVWQECMLIDGESVCTMFTEDIGERLGRIPLCLSVCLFVCLCLSLSLSLSLSLCLCLSACLPASLSLSLSLSPVSYTHLTLPTKIGV